MLKFHLKSAALFCACESLLSIGCSESTEPSGPSEVALVVHANQGELTSLAYRLSDSAGQTLDQGNDEFPGPTSSSLQLKLALQPGVNYRIKVNGMSVFDKHYAPCQGTQAFDVNAAQLNRVAIPLDCQLSSVPVAANEDTSSLNASLVINRIPAGECEVAQVVVSPLQQKVGGVISFLAMPAPIGAPSWTNSGLIGHAIVFSPFDGFFNCEAPSSGNISVKIGSSSGCTDSVSADVTCVSVPTCGNGIQEAGEECDDANSSDSDGCSGVCTILTTNCGDSIVTAHEQCDDGNLVSGDGCSSTCQMEACGDGILNPGEQCDDGESGSLACSSGCTLQRISFNCGDGVLDPSERCDDGNRNNADNCRNNCTLALAQSTCGNQLVEPGEQCDDGNSVDNDACRNDCTR